MSLHPRTVAHRWAASVAATAALVLTALAGSAPAAAQDPPPEPFTFDPRMRKREGRAR